MNFKYIVTTSLLSLISFTCFAGTITIASAEVLTQRLESAGIGYLAPKLVPNLANRCMGARIVAMDIEDALEGIGKRGNELKTLKNTAIKAIIGCDITLAELKDCGYYKPN